LGKADVRGVKSLLNVQLDIEHFSSVNPYLKKIPEPADLPI
jgi:hypothetical protein